MAGARCSPPKGQSVKSHYRSKPRALKRRAKAAAARAGGYWECFKGGRGCGTHHKTQMSALRHTKRLDRVERRHGRSADWHPRKIS
jgi:hypothetical protein